MQDMTCCKAEEYQWCRDLPVVLAGDAKAYCIFHSPPGEKGVSLEDFNSKIFELIEKNQNKQYVDLSGTIFKGDIVFSSNKECHLFPDINFNEACFCGKANFEFSRFNGKVSFVGAKFKGYADFNNVKFKKDAYFSGTFFDDVVDFSEAQFNEDALFDDSLSNGNIYFDKVIFRKTAYFTHVKFLEISNFIQAQFCEDAFFSDTNFNKKTDFHNAQFKKRAWFAHVQFSETPYFVGLHFSSAAFFAGAKFREGALFMSCGFYGVADFSLVQFDGDSRFDWVDFEAASFNESTVVSKLSFVTCTFEVEAKFQALSITGQVFFNRSNLKKASFINTKIDNINFINPQWQVENGFYLLQDEIDIRNKISNTIRQFGNSCFSVNKLFRIAKLKWLQPNMIEYENIITVYRRFKLKSIAERNESDASKWHYREMEMIRKSTSVKDFFHFVLINLYWASSGYGENPSRALVVFLILLIVITILFVVFGTKPTENIGDIFLYTLNIATLGNDITIKLQEPSGSYLKIFTKILMPTQAALFVLALRNRYKRGA